MHGAAGFSKIIYMSDLVFERPTLALVWFRLAPSPKAQEVTKILPDR
ncbi:hypothetical protein SNOG_07602 [Parastagonospora nodorum SN15]|uniref:Uncharacterized protein n=1 Tax=Phaeosphaeria nodorum (strain SN15 / ATCC MYA-4574 / FGSC 10173) TaxID=321614 RepID=Q0UKW2_PHANO|nr:hypothetical protein SNOG_07602 [Parastagonospora nodorum SN15]EAT85068.1 hypothetical protein SNOG_07602 [Parastagonospora nodorum SN15]